MKLKGNIPVEKVDIMMYQGIAALAESKIQKIDEELIPTFIIEEALNYFCELEKFESCQKIKVFFESNPTYIIQSSRAEWYGIDGNKRQNL